MIHGLLRAVLFENNGIELMLCEVLQEICTQSGHGYSRLAWPVGEC